MTIPPDILAKLTTQANEEANGYRPDAISQIAYATGRLRGLIELHQMQEENRWIPVSERTPDNYMPVLVSVSNAPKHKLVQATEWRFYDDESSAFLGMSGYDVTHWMPLPAPPGTSTSQG